MTLYLPTGMCEGLKSVAHPECSKAAALQAAVGSLADLHHQPGNRDQAENRKMSLWQLKIVRRILGVLSRDLPVFVKSLSKNKTVQCLVLCWSRVGISFHQTAPPTTSP